MLTSLNPDPKNFTHSKPFEKTTCTSAHGLKFFNFEPQIFSHIFNLLQGDLKDCGEVGALVIVDVLAVQGLVGRRVVQRGARVLEHLTFKYVHKNMNSTSVQTGRFAI